jgi:tetratricopeptide (TPR) repeat protein
MMAITMADQYYIKALDYFPFNLEEAVENLHYALSYDGEHAGANCLMGRLYGEYFKDYRKAEEFFQAALSCDPAHVESCEHYSRLLVDLKAFCKAQKLMAYARTLPGAPLSRFLQLEALAEEHQHQYAAARELLKQAMLEAFEEDFMQQLESDLARVAKKEKMLCTFLYS